MRGLLNPAAVIFPHDALKKMGKKLLLYYRSPKANLLMEQDCGSTLQRRLPTLPTWGNACLLLTLRPLGTGDPTKPPLT